MQRYSDLLWSCLPQSPLPAHSIPLPPPSWLYDPPTKQQGNLPVLKPLGGLRIQDGKSEMGKFPVYPLLIVSCTFSVCSLIQLWLLKKTLWSWIVIRLSCLEEHVGRVWCESDMAKTMENLTGFPLWSFLFTTFLEAHINWISGRK